MFCDRMHVPQHITVTGDVAVRSVYDDAGKAWAEREKVAAIMNVPDRIVVAGGDSHTAAKKSAPTEMVLDQLLNSVKQEESVMQDTPANIVLEAEPYQPETEPINRNASIAIDENPLQELKLMRRQLTKVSTRLYQVEDDLERRKARELYFGTGLVGIAAMLLFLILKR